MIKKYKLFTEAKNKFPNIKKLDIDGFTVYLGKDSKSNDHLTFNVADENDLWFHVKGHPGSHVVIKIKDKLPALEVIRKVAKLSKDNSKAKDMESATVIYCKRKFVKKNPGMNDGQVKVDYINSNNIDINE
jgi:predicted ribosome quality control (RQC) complex YloA/Tae2 family protein